MDLKLPGPDRPKAKRSIVLIGAAGLFLVAWGFVLGILVGRGNLPIIVKPQEPALVETGKDAAKPAGAAKPAEEPRPSQDFSKLVRDLETKPAPPSPPAEPPRPAPAAFGPTPPPVTLPPPAKPTPPRPEAVPPPPKPAAATAPPPAPKEPPELEPEPTPKAAAPPPAPAAKTPAKEKKPPVPAKPAKPEAGTSPAASTPATPGGWTIQVAAFRGQNEAETVARRMSNQTGLKFHVVSAEIKNKGRWYRVRLNESLSKSGAEVRLETLRRKGVAEARLVKVGR